MEAWLKPHIIWFAIGIILIVLEFQIPGVITIFFGIGAWIVAILCLFLPLSINLQLIIFLLSSLVLLALLRRFLKTFLDERFDTSGVGEEEMDEFIGQKAVVVEDITPDKKGKVEFHGTNWAAEAYETIPKGATVEIINKKNITLIVNKI